MLLHTRRLELEYARGKSLTEKLVCLLIVECYIVYVDNLARGVLDVGESIFDNREGCQTQEVHLDKSHTLNVFALELHHVQLGILSHSHRCKLLDIVLADNHTAGVDTCLSHRAFEFLGIGEGLLHQLTTLLALLGKLGHLLIDPLKGTLTLGRSELVGNKFGQSVALGKWQVLHTRHVLDGELGRHSAKGNNLSHTLLAILVDHIVEHQRTSVLVEIDINIG